MLVHLILDSLFKDLIRLQLSEFEMQALLNYAICCESDENIRGNENYRYLYGRDWEAMESSHFRLCDITLT